MSQIQTILECKLGSIKNSVQLKDEFKKKSQSLTQKIISYNELRTLKSNKKNCLLPGLKSSNKTLLQKQSSKPRETFSSIQQPKLLTSAVKLIKEKYEQNQNLQNQHHHSNGLSNYFNSRQITPINPLGSNLHNNSLIVKKRIKTFQTNKSRLQSITSEYHQLQSQTQSIGNILPAYKQKEFKLYNRILGQSEAAYQYAFGKGRKIPQKLINLWKQCLYHEDKTEIFVPVNPQDSNSIPYTHPRIFPINELEKGFQEVYGSGKQRCLKIGEEALIIEGIEKYLLKCSSEPMKMARKDYDIISDILVDCKLVQLQNYPMCYRQIEGHLKIMATRWRYQNINNETNRMLQTAIISGKNNFVDLGKSGVLSEYLLKYSNKNQFL